MEPDPENVSAEIEEALQDQLDGKARAEVIDHLENALDAAEKEEVRYEIREALQLILV